MFNPNIQFDVPKDRVVIGDGPASPFYLDGWLKWNEAMWSVKSERVVYTDGKSEYPRLEGVLYTDKKGRVVMPPRNPHLPFRFISTATEKRGRLASQYSTVMEIFMKDLLSRGFATSIALPPVFYDMRLFVWNNFEIVYRYTFMHKLPFDKKLIDNSITNKINKAVKNGYYISESSDWISIAECLKDTETRKGFSHRTDVESLILCKEFLKNNFKSYVGCSPTNEIITTGLRLITENGLVYFWSQATKKEYLNTGIVQFLHDYVLDDVYRNFNALFVDWGGANTPPVARAKESWGGVLVPYPLIRPKNLRYLGSVCKSYIKSTIFKR